MARQAARLRGQNRPRALPTRTDRVAILPTLLQIRSGNLMMKLSWFGIFTFGSVCAFITSSSGMRLLAANR